MKKALANTRFIRYQKMGIYALSAIMAIVIMIVSFPQVAGYLYNPDHAPPSSLQTVMEQFDDLYLTLQNIHNNGAEPAVILEQEAVTEVIRSITEDHYDSVVGALQKYDRGFPLTVYDSDLLALPAYNTYENGRVHRDRLLLEISRDDISITYYNADLETTFYFTTNDDKGSLSIHAYVFIINNKVMFNNPVVVCEPPATDITGIYYAGDVKKIEIFEEAEEMKFSYTDIRGAKDAESLFVGTIHKLDDNHYWLKNYPESYTERLIFNFTGNRLILFDNLRETKDGEYGLRERGIDGVDLKGRYDKV